MNQNKKNGISLIVLVITIIVMIILATAIILTIRNSDIKKKAEEAKNASNLANAKYAVSMAKAEWELMDLSEREKYDSFAEYAEEILVKSGYNLQGNGAIAVSPKGAINTKYIYTNSESKEKTVIIPEGFVVSKASTEDTVEEGLVIYEGTEKVNDKNVDFERIKRNQFVWVPVDDIDEFIRVPWGFGGVAPTSARMFSYSITIAAETEQYNAMKASVEKYGGFYIARYEAGMENNNTVVSKKDALTYSPIGWDEVCSATNPTLVGGTFENYGAAKVANGMYNTGAIKSHLIYAEEWDAALNFIAETDADYPTNSVDKGNYSGSKKETGIYAVSNIYDMAGNLQEWTMEFYNNLDAYGRRIKRGGSYNDSGDTHPASYRYSGALPYNLSTNTGFRVALYLI